MTAEVDVLKKVLQNKRFQLVRLIRAHNPEETAVLSTLNRTLTQVEGALIALETGVYAVCIECGEPNSSRGLATMP